MKKILCFGDSNTYGFNPLNGLRYTQSERWSGILKEKLKDKYLVIEQGCNNRTAVCGNVSVEMTGYKAIKQYLKDDLDIVILQVGINDMQFLYNYELSDFQNKFQCLISSIKDVINEVKIILLCPSIIDECILKSGFSLMFDKISIERSKKLPEIFNNLAKKECCKMIDLNSVVEVSKIDGLHYDIENHQKIAKKLLDDLL